MPSKLLDRAPKQAPASPMNWKPRSADDLIGQARRVAASQIGKAKRMAGDASATVKLLLYGPPGVGKTSVVELIAHELSGSSLAIEDYNGREVTVDLVREWMRALPYGSLFRVTIYLTHLIAVIRWSYENKRPSRNALGCRRILRGQRGRILLHVCTALA